MEKQWNLWSTNKSFGNSQHFCHTLSNHLFPQFTAEPCLLKFYNWDSMSRKFSGISRRRDLRTYTKASVSCASSHGSRLSMFRIKSCSAMFGLTSPLSFTTKPPDEWKKIVYPNTKKYLGLTLLGHIQPSQRCPRLCTMEPFMELDNPRCELRRVSPGQWVHWVPKQNEKRKRTSSWR